MIRDVSREWAQLLESEAADEKKYANACEDACEQMQRAEEAEISEFDEEVIDPRDCGFTEEDIECEAVDPLDMWKQLKKEAPAKANVKVDSNYINTMKKLLSKIKSSKAQLYNTVMQKLEAYKAAGTELPPPEDYAENFVPFEMIAKLAGGKEDKTDDEMNRDADAAELDARAFATDRSAEEYKDATGAFGNDMADQNLYDSEMTEAEEEEAEKKAIEALADAKEEIKGAYSEEEVQQWLEKNKAKIEGLKLKDAKTAEALKNLMKILEKYSKGELEESEVIDEKSGDKKKGPVKQLVKATLRFMNWILKLLPLGIIGSAWVIKKIGNVAMALNQKIDKGLAEAIALEIGDEAKALEERDVEELDADGVTPKKVEEAACKNQDDPATHLLDAVGVKASTASLKAQDAAMISVVEMLMQKINALEKQLNESKPVDLSKKPGTITKLFIDHKDEAFATKTAEELYELVKRLFEENGINTPASRRMLMNFERSRSYVNSLQYYVNIFSKGSGMGLGEADDEEEDEELKLDIDDLGLSAEDRKNYEAAKKIQDISYRRELTKAEEDKFRDLLGKLSDLAKDYLLKNTMGPEGFARPGDIPLVDDPTVHPDDGGGDGMGGFKKATVDFDKKVPIAPFNYKQGSHRETSAEKRKEQRAEWEKQRKADTPQDQIAWPRTKAGDETWEVNAMNLFASSLSDAQKRELMNSMIADIEAENKAVRDSGELSDEELKELDAVNAEEKAFIKTIFTHKTPTTREQAPIFGMSHLGVSKAARKTLEMIRDTFKDVLGTDVDLEKNPQNFADACDEMSDADWDKFNKLLKIKSDGRINKKLMQGNDREKKDAVRAKIQAVRDKLNAEKTNESDLIPEDVFMSEGCKSAEEDKETK